LIENNNFQTLLDSLRYNSEQERHFQKCDSSQAAFFESFPMFFRVISIVFFSGS